MIDSSTPLVEDSWLYQWTGCPPEPFVRHKTLFRQCIPADISYNGWTVLKPAVKELSNIFDIQKPADTHKLSVSVVDPSVDFEWLSLNNHAERPCLMGLYGDEYVVAAAPLAQIRKPFVPFNLYRSLSGNSLLKNTRYKATYRHFFAEFDTGYSFCILRQNLLCEVSYAVDMTVHSIGVMWAVINIAGVRIPAPNWFPLRANLSNLCDTIERANNECSYFVQQMGMSWLTGCGAEQIFNLLRRLSRIVGIPQYAMDALRNDPKLDRLLTRLDLLCLLAQTLNFRSDEQISKLIPLSQILFNERKKQCPRLAERRW